MTECVDCGTSTEPDLHGGFARCPDCHSALLARARKELRSAGRKKVTSGRVDYDRRGKLTEDDLRLLEAHRNQTPTDRRPVAEERADRIVALVSETGRKSRRELAIALGISPTSAAEAAARAVADGRLVSRSGSPKTAGYYPPETVAA